MTALFASLLVPGAGQAIAGRRERGAAVLAAAVGVAAVVGWWAGAQGDGRVWLLAVPFWLAQAVDARTVASGRASSTARLVLLGLLPVYAVGWQATDVAPARLVERFDKARPFFSGLAAPDLLDPVEITDRARVRVWTPCPAEGVAAPGVQPEDPARSGPELEVDPPCAALGERLDVRGWGFEPGSAVELIWLGPTGDPAPLSAVAADAAGSFQTSLVVPVDSIPARVRERRPGVPQDQALEAVARVSSDGVQPSRTLRVIMENLGVTLALGFMATVVGAGMAIPLSLLGARNLMRGNRLARLVYGVVRAAMNAVRSIESLILAVVFVVWVGQGPFAGMLALAVHTTAALGKLVSEAIENIDAGPIEAVRATGAGWLQVVRYAVLPQVLPPFTAFTVYRYDINVRMSTIVGFVGGGGIGFLLQQWIAKSRWSETSTAVIVIAIVLIVLDQASASVRERIAEGRPVARGYLRPVALAALVAFAAWAWRTAEVDPGRLVRDAHKVAPLAGELLTPELLERASDTAALDVALAVPCAEAGASGAAAADDTRDQPGADASGEGGAGMVGGDMSLALDRSCAAPGEIVTARLEGVPTGSSVRARWLLPDGRRLPAGSAVVDGGVAVAQVEVRPILADLADAEGAPPRLELEAATPSGGLRPSEPLRVTASTILESVLMALMATTFGAVLALPLAFAGARNAMPRTALGTAVYYTSRTFMNVSRAIEPLVLAAVFAVWVGVGSPFAGVLALVVVTMANLGKLFSEAVEDIDPGPVEAVQAAGAGRAQAIAYGMFPQVVPPFLAFGIYHWDINVRISTIVGFVGGGGIGFVLYEWMKVTRWSWASVAILAIIIVVAAMDALSARVRQRLV